MISDLVGRTEELKHLQAIADTVESSGRVVLVAGNAGVGKTALIREFSEQLTTPTRARPFTSAAGNCFEVTSSNDAYEPFKTIVRNLARPQRARDLSAPVIEILKSVGPDLLDMVPGLGSVAAAARIAVKASEEMSAWRLGDSQERLQLADSVANQYVEVIGEVSNAIGPLLVIVEDAHWIDSASASLIARIARIIDSLPILLIVSYRTALLDGSQIQVVKQELVGRGQAEVTDLSGLDAVSVRNLVYSKYAISRSPTGFVEWLTQISGGLPLFVTQFLRLLEDRKIVRSEDGQLIVALDFELLDDHWSIASPSGDLQMPATVNEVLAQRIDRLDPVGREMLTISSVQGYQFMSSVLDEMLVPKDPNLLRSLRELEQRDSVIRAQNSEPWALPRTDIYTFDHVLLRQAFYDRLSRTERIQHHANAATVLARLVGEIEAPIPRRLVLAVARNYRQSEDYGEAALYELRAAESCYREGAFREASRSCVTAIADLSKLRQPSSADDRCMSSAISILLATSEVQWLRFDMSDDAIDLEKMLAQADAASGRLGDELMAAQIRLLRARRLVVVGSLLDAVAELGEVALNCRVRRDLVGEATALIELGHHQIAVSPSEAQRSLSRAEELLGCTDLTTGVPRSVLERMRLKLRGFIAVGMFDRGDFGASEASLRVVCNELAQARMFDLFGLYSNFLAQVQIAGGKYEDANAVLVRALDIRSKFNMRYVVPSAYNRALLGKLYLEWQRFEEAGNELERGWREIQAWPDNSILPLVANYLAEFLLDGRSGHQDLDRARELLDWSRENSVSHGFRRSVVVSNLLLGRLALQNRAIDAAIEYSRLASEELWTAGMLPAVRTEEVFFWHSEILRIANRPDWQLWLTRAYDALTRKADSISCDQDRSTFLDRVSLSRAIRNRVAA